MDASPENQEKKPESVEGGAGGDSAEKEAEKASSKGANEAYGTAKNDAGSKLNDETVFGLSTKKEDWTQVDETTFQTKDGDTWSLVDSQAGGSLLYGQNDWKTLFSWSTEQRNGQDTAKSESTDSWLSSLGFDNIFGSSDKTPKEEPAKAEEKPQNKSLLDKLSDLEWKDVQNYLSDAFAGDSQDQKEASDSKGKASGAGDISLPDGSKVANDGSWVQLSPEAQKLAETAKDKPIVHKYKDQDGKEVSLEIQEGRVFHIAGDGTRTEVTDKRIEVNGTDGTVTTKNKETGEVRAQNTERGLSYQQGQDGSGTFTVGDVKFTRRGNEITIVDGDNNTQILTPEQLQIELGKRRIRQSTSSERTGEAPKAPDKPGDVQTSTEGVGFRDKDGSIIAVNIPQRLVSIRLKDGPEILIDRQGEVRVRQATGEPQALDRSKLPPGVTIDADGGIRLPNGMKIGRDGRLHTSGGDVVDSATGDVTVKDESTGKLVTIRTAENGSSTITDDKGREVSHVEPDKGVVTTTTSDGKTSTYNCRTRELTVGDAAHPDIVFKPSGVRLWDGSEVGPHGEILLADGTYIDEEGNVRFYDGTEVDKDGDVVSADGKTFSSKHEGVRLSTSGIASYANALASSIAGKSNPAPGDIAALQAALGVLGSLLPALTNAGCMDVYAKLKDSQGNILQALSQAQGKGQPTGNSQNDPRAPQGQPAGAPARTAPG